MSLLDFEQGKRPSRFRLKPAKLLIALGSVCALVFGYTFASNINLNGNQAVEFGQGVLRTTACDQDGLTLTPYSAFINGDSNFTPVTLTADSNEITNGRVLYTDDTNFSSIRVGDSVTGTGIPADSFITNIAGGYFAINNSYSGEIASTILTISRPAGRFLLNAIELAGVDSRSGQCANKSFTIKVYNSTDSSPLSTYDVYDTGTNFTSASGNIESNFDVTEESSMLLTIEEPTVAATNVYRITIESKDETNLALNRIGLWPGSSCGSLSEDCVIPNSDQEPFYCADGVCNLVFLSASDFLQFQFDQCEANGLDSCSDQVDPFRSATYSLSKNNSQDPEMAWQILITQPGSFGPFQNALHLSGQILYSNGQYAVFRWFLNTDPDDQESGRNYVDLIISLGGSLPLSNPYTGPTLFGEPPEITFYELSWNY